jgi:uncharacterized membrane protein
MFCPKCGAENAEGSSFCQKCGASLTPEVSKPRGTSTGLEPNVAGLLCYLLGWITGLIFFLVEKENEFVRFHAKQSIVVFGAFSVISILLFILGLIPYIGLLFFVLNVLVGILSLVLWVMLMIKAYHGERYKLPWAGDFAEKHL